MIRVCGKHASRDNLITDVLDAQECLCWYVSRISQVTLGRFLLR